MVMQLNTDPLVLGFELGLCWHWLKIMKKMFLVFTFKRAIFDPTTLNSSLPKFFFPTKHFLGKSYKNFLNCHICNLMQSVASAASLSKFVIKTVSYHSFFYFLIHYFCIWLFHSHFNLPWHHAFSMCINILLCSLINQYWTGLKCVSFI